MVYSIGLFAEGGEGGMGWLVWVGLAVFFLMVLLGWWVSQKGWLKPEEETVSGSHGHETDAHEQLAHKETPSQPVAAEPASQPDDLTTLEGIGPKVAKLLEGSGITTFQQLAQADLAKLREMLDAAGYKYMEPSGWVEQAALAAKGDWEGLKKLQETLKGGRKVN
ncbi:MAG: helix-hairpin-helix domain-containing protein [Anaerolineales bacterium]|nr:helix-hairpin-helix domain-containing protein [Anaerolineales bacterium]